MGGKLCFIITGLALGFMGGCASTDDCALTGTCSCEDPSFGPSHPEVCSCSDPYYGDAHRDLCSPPDALDGSASDATLTADGPEEAATVEAGAADGEGGPADARANEASDGGAADALADVKEEPLPPPCDATKLPSEDACVIDAKYGVFVSPLGNDTNAGTTMSPLKTLDRAISVAASRSLRVYACATAGNYDERLSVGSAVTLFGGFDCTTFVWSYAKTNIAHVKPPAGIALTLQGSQRIELENISFEALDATEPGGSSIAAFANQATNVVLRRVTLIAGKGKAGAEVTTTPNYTAAAAPDGNSTTTAMGAAEHSCAALCANGVHATGGKGGDGTAVAPALRGGDGKPLVAQADPPGAVGSGGDGKRADNLGCSNGLQGSNAPPPPGGAGAAKWGTLSSTGWSTAAAAPGTVGAPGQGGGGGGGGVFAAGGKGGGGGGACGGCGGAGGPAGNAGGSSFALLSYMSTVTLDSCTLLANTAGAGSKGGDGQGGQPGGTAGGVQSATGCPGGPGGTGAQGGGGGGGAGGLSVAIGYIGTAPTKGIDTFAQAAVRPATGGAAGLGGSPPASQGKDGVALPMQDLGP